jgi:hypothetical protein
MELYRLSIKYLRDRTSPSATPSAPPQFVQLQPPVHLDKPDHQLTSWKEAGKHQIDLQFRSFESLDSRIASYLGLGSTVLTISFALLNLKSTPPGRSLIALSIASVFYVAMVLYCLLRLRGNKLEAKPALFDVGALIDAKLSSSAIEGFIAKSHSESVIENAKILEEKAAHAFQAGLLFYAEIVLIIIAAAFVANAEKTCWHWIKDAAPWLWDFVKRTYLSSS